MVNFSVTKDENSYFAFDGSLDFEDKLNVRTSEISAS